MAGTDHSIAFALRWWEWGLSTAVFYTFSPGIAEPLGCHVAALNPQSRRPRTAAAAFANAVAIILTMLLVLPLVLPLGAIAVLLRVLTHCCKPEFTEGTPAVVPCGPALMMSGFGTELTLFTCNVALSEFEIMNAINGLRVSRNRKSDLWDFLEGAFSPMPDVLCFQEAFSPAAVRFLRRKLTGTSASSSGVATQAIPSGPSGSCCCF